MMRTRRGRMRWTYQHAVGFHVLNGAPVRVQIQQMMLKMNLREVIKHRGLVEEKNRQHDVESTRLKEFLHY